MLTCFSSWIGQLHTRLHGIGRKGLRVQAVGGR